MTPGAGPQRTAATESKQAPLLEVRGLKKYFPVTTGMVWRRTVSQVKAVDDVSFALHKGETMGLVGESGCGKTTTGLCILNLERPSAGAVFYEGQNLSALQAAQLIPWRRRLQVIFQDPYSSLNPRMKVGRIVADPIRVHKLIPDARKQEARVAELLSMCGLSRKMADRYPHEMSGGQRQRVGIARALATNPEFIVCDEAVSALDVSIQAQIINLLEDLRDELGITYLFISHDLSVVRHLCQQVAVMYLGRIVEMASTETLFTDPKHPYTRFLLAAIPIPDPEIESRRDFNPVQGEIPSPMNPPGGCVFHPRCPKATKECAWQRPPLKEIDAGHQVACMWV